MSLGTQFRIAAIVPCHNEEIAIAKVVTDLRAAVPGMTVYVYDNCSTDRTIEQALAAGAVVCSEPLKGKGNVVRRAFADIDADIYLLIDGDDSYDAAAAPRMIEKLVDENLDHVVGVRREVAELRSDSAYRPAHATGNRVLNGIVSRHLRRQHGRHAQRLPGVLAPLREELPGGLPRVRDRDRADRALTGAAGAVGVDARRLPRPCRGQRVEAAHLPRRLADPRDDHEPHPPRAADVLLRPARRDVRAAVRPGGHPADHALPGDRHRASTRTRCSCRASCS